MIITDLYVVQSQGQCFLALLDDKDNTAFLSSKLPAQMLTDVFNSKVDLALDRITSQDLEWWKLNTDNLSMPEFQRERERERSQC